MYKLNPPHVYIHQSVAETPRYLARAQRVIDGLANTPPVTVYTDDELPVMIKEQGLLAGQDLWGAIAEPHDPMLLFNSFRFDGRREERLAWLQQETGIGRYHAAEALTGYGPFCWFSAFPGRGDEFHDDICRPCWRLHFQNGCAHRCHYCGLNGLLSTMVNVEDYIAQLDRLIQLNPWQETYLLEDDADVLILEPELGCLGPLIEYFGTLDGRYLIIHTKSANVDWMKDLRHNGNTIIVWSLSGQEQSTRLEPVCGSMHERIDAARRASEMGYCVRYKFKPIIPMIGWREQATEAITAALASSKPDLISLCVFMWLRFPTVERCIDLSLLDPAFVDAARMSDAPGISTRSMPFPNEMRALVYEHYLNEIARIDPDIPVSLSTESPDMWKMLAGKLKCTPTNYVCGCGPNSIPNRRQLCCHPYKIAESGPVGGFELM